MPLPARLESEDRLHLTTKPGSPCIQRKGVSGHRRSLQDSEVRTIGGLRLTSVARTWLDLAARLDVDSLVVAADWLVSEHERGFGDHRLPRIALHDLSSYVQSRRGARCCRRADQALALTRVGVDSPPETRLRLLLHRADLPEFTVNCRVDSPRGRTLWTDLGCRAYRVCVEYEGLHHLTPEQQARDHERDALTALAGWRQIKVNRLQLRRPEAAVLGPIRRALLDNGWHG